MRAVLSFLLLAFLGAVQALSSTGSRLLVVLEEAGEKSKYSKFWGDLEARGFSLSFESPKSTSLALFKHGEIAYDHVILLPPKSKGLGPNLTPNLLVDYVNKNGNVLLALSADQPTPAAISSLLLELDIALPPERNALVVDHVNYDVKSAAEKHDVLLLPAPKSLKPGVKDYFSVDGLIAIPRAVGQVLGNASPLLAPILKAPATAYSYNPKDDAEAIEDPFAVGSQLSLVTTFQARNSARFTVLGSVEMLEDKWFDAKVKKPDGSDSATVNQAFAEKVSAWTFKELGVIKVGRLQHFLNEDLGTGRNLTIPEFTQAYDGLYRIKNNVHFEVELSEYDMDHFVPYTPPSNDAVQLEFSMLSPFHRLTLEAQSQTADSTVYSASFTLPDQHGIFNFIVNYKRPFLTNVYEKRTVTVRHFAHDEWPRSFVITGAYPWITGIAVTVSGWLVFVAIWLYSAPAQDRTKKSQ